MRNPKSLATAGVMAAALLLSGCEYPSSYDAYEEDSYDDYSDDSYDDSDYEEDDGGDWFVDLVVGFTFDSSDGHDGGGGRGTAPSVASRSDLVRGASPSDSDARGVTAVARRGPHERFAVRVVDLDPGMPMDLYVANRSDVLLHIAAASADGRGTISFSPAYLPAGVASLEELAGRRVELRDGARRVLLSGRVPALRGRGADVRASRGYRDDGTGVRVKISLAAVRSAGRQVFRLEARGLTAGVAAELRILGDAGQMVPMAAGTADAGGRFSIRADSRNGDPLPGGEEWIESLGGRPFEVRCGAEVVADGELPAL